MDMSNTTAAGPSRGILDLIFGSSNDPEAAQAGGQEFGNLMNLIKALNGKKEAEEKGADAGWTNMETMLGKGVVENGAVGMPGANAAAPFFFSDQLSGETQAGDFEQRQRLQRLAELGISGEALAGDFGQKQRLQRLAEPGISGEALAGDFGQKQRLQRLAELGIPGALSAQQMLANTPPLANGSGGDGISASLVNDALKARGLSGLSSREAKLLEKVNQQATGSVKVQGESLPFTIDTSKLKTEPDSLGKSATALAGKDLLNANSKLENGLIPSKMDASLEAQVKKILVKKDGDPKNLKGVEMSTASVNPDSEKILTTEAYLQMHGNMNSGNKASARNLAEKDVVAAGNEMSKPAALQGESLTANAVAQASSKGGNLKFGEQDGKSSSSEIRRSSKLDPKADGSLVVGASSQMITPETTRDVFVPGLDKPEQLRSALLGEIGNGVATHAFKGGGEMRLIIHPEDLGEVKLKVGTKNGKVEVMVTADNEDVAKILRRGSKELEASLKEQNLSLSKIGRAHV